jgi:hypothetical protein
MELTAKQEKELNKHLGLGRHTKQEAELMRSEMEKGNSVSSAHNAVEDLRRKKANKAKKNIVVSHKPMSEWQDFLAKWRKSHPSVKGKEAMRKAGEEYRKKKGTKGAVNISRVKSNAKKGEGDTMDFTTKKGDLIKTGARKGQKAFSRQKTPMAQSSY